tara:strand:+ start:252 stop:1328 length:1077 start_codon:yes stop_codon:yes gene_type:complete
MEDPNSIKDRILKSILNISKLDDLEELRIDTLGKKGEISLLMRQLGNLESNLRREQGIILNALRKEVENHIKLKKQTLENEFLNNKLLNEKIDISLPSRPEMEGRIHPLTRTLNEVISIFSNMGFSVAEGPDIETDYYNFTALNIPQEHPARQEHDTFYMPNKILSERRVLRTHTSPVQVRTMETSSPPIKVIVPGRTYRSDHDSTHSPMFHQCEGLYIAENINMGHLKGCLIDFCRTFFNEDDLPVRFRPSYFPFTEPSAEVDIGCSKKDGELKIGKGDEWLEILGSGMVNPRVLDNAGIDSKKYQGFAFGMGLERITMLKFGIPDLRPFFENDLRWMKHYGFMSYENVNFHAGFGS